MNVPPPNDIVYIQVKKRPKKGHVSPVIPIITPNNDKPKEESRDKSRIVTILQSAGVNVTDDVFAKLPTWDTIVQLYGPSPIIYGLDTCSTFQQTISKNEAYIGPAGTFNTGTNLLADLLPKYCMIDKVTKRSGILWQVPWGEHNPISWRFRNIAIGTFQSCCFEMDIISHETYSCSPCFSRWEGCKESGYSVTCSNN